MSRLAFCHVFLDIRITQDGLFVYHMHSEKTIVAIPDLNMDSAKGSIIYWI
jgi:hypothetical protein